ncbi:POX [Musa troglodytarum]|uniref:POX n=1 Tax=Musa troglodytarum TaxID=320322 RepID=A0A9E7HXP5_9LILI|nr:POX [Musa troglodytarum]
MTSSGFALGPPFVRDPLLVTQLLPSTSSCTYWRGSVGRPFVVLGKRAFQADKSDRENDAPLSLCCTCPLTAGPPHRRSNHEEGIVMGYATGDLPFRVAVVWLSSGAVTALVPTARVSEASELALRRRHKRRREAGSRLRRISRCRCFRPPFPDGGQLHRERILPPPRTPPAACCIGLLSLSAPCMLPLRWHSATVAEALPPLSPLLLMSSRVGILMMS